MFEKAGKYYADWRDASGKRLRKSFTSRRAALQFEEEQKELTHPKQRARSQRSPRYSAPATLSAPVPRPAKPQKPSSRKPVPCLRANSAPLTSRKSKTLSLVTATHSPRK